MQFDVNYNYPSSMIVIVKKSIKVSKIIDYIFSFQCFLFEETAIFVHSLELEPFWILCITRVFWFICNIYYIWSSEVFCNVSCIACAFYQLFDQSLCFFKKSDACYYISTEITNVVGLSKTCQINGTEFYKEKSLIYDYLVWQLSSAITF